MLTFTAAQAETLANAEEVLARCSDTDTRELLAELVELRDPNFIDKDEITVAQGGRVLSAVESWFYWNADGAYETELYRQLHFIVAGFYCRAPLLKVAA